MSDRTSDAVHEILKKFVGTPTHELFSERLLEGSAITRDEHPISHFCVYFAGFDPFSKRVFMGHHKKSDLWLFNGGHIDPDETPLEALIREIGEEWGPEACMSILIDDPSLITVTEIYNTRQSCRQHYDIWYFIPLSRRDFLPDWALLAKEFYEARWLRISEGLRIAKDPATLEALEMLSEIMQMT